MLLIFLFNNLFIIWITVNGVIFDKVLFQYPSKDLA